MRRRYAEWRGAERPVRAEALLGTVLNSREAIWRQSQDLAPFSDDWLALCATLDHLNRLADHFGVEPLRVPPATKAPGPPMKYRVP